MAIPGADEFSPFHSDQWMEWKEVHTTSLVSASLGAPHLTDWTIKYSHSSAFLQGWVAPRRYKIFSSPQHWRSDWAHLSTWEVWGPLRILKQRSCSPWYHILFHVCACKGLTVCGLEQVLQRKGFLSYALEYKRNGRFNEQFQSKGWYIMTEKWPSSENLPGFLF